MVRQIIKSFLLLWCVLTTHITLAQLYQTKEGLITFDAGNIGERIKASSKRVYTSYNTEDHRLKIIVPISSFQFKNKVMQRHFNENYMESEKYPLAIFEGVIEPSITKASDSVSAKGVMNIHGVKKPMTISAFYTKSKTILNFTAVFDIRCEDHHIESPKVLNQALAETLNVRYEASITYP